MQNHNLDRIPIRCRYIKRGDTGSELFKAYNEIIAMLLSKVSLVVRPLGYKKKGSR